MADKRADTEAFAKDFGYLWPFFDRLDAAAAGVADPEAMRAAVADARGACQRIHAALQGTAAPTQPQTELEPSTTIATGAASDASAEIADAQPPAKAASPAPQPAAASWTVGPLHSGGLGEPHT